MIESETALNYYRFFQNYYSQVDRFVRDRYFLKFIQKIYNQILVYIKQNFCMHISYTYCFHKALCIRYI